MDHLQDIEGDFVTNDVLYPLSISRSFYGLFVCLTSYSGMFRLYRDVTINGTGLQKFGHLLGVISLQTLWNFIVPYTYCETAPRFLSCHTPTVRRGLGLYRAIHLLWDGASVFIVPYTYCETGPRFLSCHTPTVRRGLGFTVSSEGPSQCGLLSR